jgi:uncharacterized protein (UPF0332 family)
MNKHTIIIQKRLIRATTELRNAGTLASDEQWNAITNRLYYAAFYAVSALLLSVDQKTVTQRGRHSF